MVLTDQRKFLKLFPFREIRGKQGFQPKSGGKFKSGNFFFKTIFKAFNLRKFFFKNVKTFFCQELSGNCT